MGQGHKVNVLVETDDTNKTYYVEEKYFTSMSDYRQAMVNAIQLYQLAKQNGYKVILRLTDNDLVNNVELVQSESTGIKR